MHEVGFPMKKLLVLATVFLLAQGCAGNQITPQNVSGAEGIASQDSQKTAVSQENARNEQELQTSLWAPEPWVEEAKFGNYLAEFIVIMMWLDEMSGIRELVDEQKIRELMTKIAKRRKDLSVAPIFAYTLLALNPVDTYDGIEEPTSLPDSDRQMALDYLEYAAELDKPHAQYILYLIYRNTIGVKQNHKKQESLLDKAANNGLRLAMIDKYNQALWSNARERAYWNRKLLLSEDSISTDFLYTEPFHENDSLDEEVIKSRLARGMNIDDTGDYEKGYTALMSACQWGNADYIKTLLKYGANPNVQDGKGMTPILYAIKRHDFYTIKIGADSILALLDAGADLNATDTEGRNPLMVVLQEYGDEKMTREITDLILDNMTDEQVNYINKSTQGNALHFLGYNTSPEIIEKLIKRGVDPKQIDKNGDTVLMKELNPEAMQVLIAAGASVNARNKDGKTAMIMLANRSDYPEMFDTLYEAGAEIDVADKNGRTALYYSVMDRNFRMASWLVHQGANVNRKDNKGKTVIEYLEDCSQSSGSRGGYDVDIQLIRVLQMGGARGRPKKCSHR